MKIFEDLRALVAAIEKGTYDVAPPKLRFGPELKVTGYCEELDNGDVVVYDDDGKQIGYWKSTVFKNEHVKLGTTK